MTKLERLQNTYNTYKNAYETAFKAENWDEVDKLEDLYLDAEFALVEWTFEVLVTLEKMTEDEVTTLRRKSNNEQWEKIVDMAARLKIEEIAA